MRTDVEQFVEGLGQVNWLQPDGKPNPEWKLFQGSSWAEARGAAWDEAYTWGEAMDAAGFAAREAVVEASAAAGRDTAALEAGAVAGRTTRAAVRAAAADAPWLVTGDASGDAALKAEYLV